ncbi:uncharacterized protein PFL1_04638 [Pseudozyma flocculosa PF-1]|uniref:Uncharacterized protein n=2 Tax=Pseudozyma flocculosa TaxID=84751 RepID=A0A5C3FDB9_9BASI|nr:uncharacterized protein PFL1_04638 [Pseudozyma flocculosa PF-1]EPQ27894.1 hypothetical protein PFL1_04638 [Pseudozyma flocculosa PF-1]SPO41675.1 uncharacterized protein PSFLO_07157 [Pseudozyma flocculosa]
MFSPAARNLVSRHLGAGVASIPARRGLHTSLRVANNEPKFKREGPAASPLDPNKFDNQANSPGYYEAHKYKEQARADPNPTAPLQNRAAEPEPETPHGQSGSFSDHRGGGPRVDGEALTGSEEAPETRTHRRAAQKIKNAAKTIIGQRSLFTSAYQHNLKPTQGARNTPAKTSDGSVGEHPGYTTADAPVSSRDPKDMPPPPPGAMPSSTIQNASTKAAPPHPDVHGLATGAEKEGVDSILPEDRSQKTWGMNARSAQFNETEGKRNPVLHGGSNEGGFKGDGSSRT